VRLILFGTTVLVLLVLAQTVQACDCVTLSPRESFDRANVVFEGELLGVSRTPGRVGFRMGYHFEVSRSLKGQPPSVVIILSDDSDCDAQFMPNVIYRVYAQSYEEGLTSSSCAGNEVLGVIRRDRSYRTVDVPLWRRGLINVAAACGLGVLLGSGVFVWRRYIKK